MASEQHIAIKCSNCMELLEQRKKKRLDDQRRKKRGPKKGSKNNTNDKTRLDWFKVCDDWSKSLSSNSTNTTSKMGLKKFLASDATSSKFLGTESERRSFSNYLKEYNNGTLTADEVPNTKRKSIKELPPKAANAAIMDNKIELMESKMEVENKPKEDTTEEVENDEDPGKKRLWQRTLHSYYRKKSIDELSMNS